MIHNDSADEFAEKYFVPIPTMKSNNIGEEQEITKEDKNKQTEEYFDSEDVSDLLSSQAGEGKLLFPHECYITDVEFINNYLQQRAKIPLCVIALLMHENRKKGRWISSIYKDFIAMEKVERDKVLAQYESLANQVVLPCDQDVTDRTCELLKKIFPTLNSDYISKVLQSFPMLADPQYSSIKLDQSFITMEKEINRAIRNKIIGQAKNDDEIKGIIKKYCSTSGSGLSDAIVAAILIVITQMYLLTDNKDLLQDENEYCNVIVNKYRAHGFKNMEDLYLRTYYIVGIINLK